MASFLLVFSIAAMGLVIFWYVFEEATRGGEGKGGILGMTDSSKDPGQAGAGSKWKTVSERRPWRIHRR
ncbi:MAG: hypothetical protein K8S25_12300 [Alphaproteobacteria bacterium]|nr:hypothetical protein [Alphaproteobacteria bacterium]